MLKPQANTMTNFVLHYKKRSEAFRKEMNDRYEMIKDADEEFLSKRKIVLQKNLDEASQLKKLYTLEIDDNRKENSSFNKKFALTVSDFKNLQNKNYRTLSNDNAHIKLSHRDSKEDPIKNIINNKKENLKVNLKSKRLLPKVKEEIETKSTEEINIKSERKPLIISHSSQNVFEKSNTQFNKTQNLKFQNSIINNNNTTRNNSVSERRSQYMINHKQNTIKKSLNFYPKMSFLQILPEDEIFDQLQNIEIKEKEFNTTLFKIDGIRKKLNKVYHIDINHLNDVKKAKKLKNLELEKYQNNLINTLGNCVSRENKIKLTDKMRKLRILVNNTNQVDGVIDYLEEIEKREEEIIKNLINKEKKLEKLRSSGFFISFSPLPKLRHKKFKLIK